MSGGGSEASAYAGAFADVMNWLGTALSWEGNQNAAAANYRSALDNAVIAQHAAGEALRRGNIAAGALRIRGTQMVAEQASAYSAGGVEATVGTPAENAKTTGAMTELDAQTVANNAARQAWGLRHQAADFGRQAMNVQNEWSNYSLNQLGKISGR